MLHILILEINAYCLQHQRKLYFLIQKRRMKTIHFSNVKTINLSKFYKNTIISTSYQSDIDDLNYLYLTDIEICTNTFLKKYVSEFDVIGNFIICAVQHKHINFSLDFSLDFSSIDQYHVYHNNKWLIFNNPNKGYKIGLIATNRLNRFGIISGLMIYISKEF